MKGLPRCQRSWGVWWGGGGGGGGGGRGGGGGGLQEGWKEGGTAELISQSRNISSKQPQEEKGFCWPALFL